MNTPNSNGNRRAPAYTRQELQRWKADMLLKRPTTRHVEDMVQGVNLVSFDIQAAGNGMNMLVVNSHGEEMMILLNPVLAAALRDGITKCGQEGNWLEEDGTPTVPDR